MPDPRQFAFWSQHEAGLWDTLAPVILSILGRGARSGEQALPPIARVFIDWDYFNQSAIDYLYQYRLGPVAGITNTTSKQAIKAIDEWIKGGESLPVLEARLAPIFGDTRAARIAVTETTRIFSDANQIAWKASGIVSANVWRTARDDLVCKICRPLNNMTVSLGENGFTTEAGGLGITAPPAHTGCRCWLQPVVSEELLRQQLRRGLYRVDENALIRELFGWGVKVVA